MGFGSSFGGLKREIIVIAVIFKRSRARLRGLVLPRDFLFFSPPCTFHLLLFSLSNRRVPVGWKDVTGNDDAWKSNQKRDCVTRSAMSDRESLDDQPQSKGSDEAI